MFFINIQTEPRSSRPGLLQTMVDMFTAMMNTVSILWSLVSPVNAATVMSRMNRNVARAYRMA